MDNNNGEDEDEEDEAALVTYDNGSESEGRALALMSTVAAVPVDITQDQVK